MAKKRLIPPKTIKSSQIDYYSELYALITQIKKRFDNVVLEKAGQKKVQNEIVDQSALSALRAAFAEFKKKINEQINAKRIRNLAKGTTNRLVKRNKKAWQKKMGNLGIDISKKMTFKGEADYIRSRIKTNARLITNMKTEYIEELEQLLFMSYEQGTPIGQLTKDIEKRFKITSRKAKLIARNETKNTNTQMNNKQVEELGFDTAVWIANLDGRERPEHRKHNRKKYKVGVGLDDGKGGKEEPGDAINCLHPDSIINFAKAKKLTRRKWIGKMVTIKDSLGNKITVTPNHPILTISGWKGAGFLQKGDKIISSLASESSTSSNFNIKDVDSSIEEIFNSVGVIGVSVRVGTIDMNFHGDISDHDVNIIPTNSFLGNRINSPAFKDFDKVKLPFADLLKGSLLASRLLNKPRISSFHLFPSFVSLSTKILPFFKRSVFHSKEHSLRSISRLNSNIGQSGNNCGASISHFLRNSFYRITGLKKIFTDHALFRVGKITEVIHSEYDGYVYNLETENNIYICNNIVNHNCRCTFYIEVDT